MPSTFQDVINIIQIHKAQVAAFGITAEANYEISNLIKGLGDQIASDNGMTNQEAVGNLSLTMELSVDAEIIFDQLKRLVHK